jgi:hypothetical protein
MRRGSPTRCAAQGRAGSPKHRRARARLRRRPLRPGGWFREGAGLYRRMSSGCLCQLSGRFPVLGRRRGRAAEARLGQAGRAAGLSRLRPGFFGRCASFRRALPRWSGEWCRRARLLLWEPGSSEGWCPLSGHLPSLAGESRRCWIRVRPASGPGSARSRRAGGSAPRGGPLRSVAPGSEGRRPRGGGRPGWAGSGWEPGRGGVGLLPGARSNEHRRPLSGQLPSQVRELSQAPEGELDPAPVLELSWIGAWSQGPQLRSGGRFPVSRGRPRGRGGRAPQRSGVGGRRRRPHQRLRRPPNESPAVHPRPRLHPPTRCGPTPPPDGARPACSPLRASGR